MNVYSVNNYNHQFCDRSHIQWNAGNGIYGLPPILSQKFASEAKKNWNELKEQERQFLSFRSIPADLCS
jgi:hypothetical protein